MENGEKKHLRTIWGNVGKKYNFPLLSLFSPPPLLKKRVILSVGITCGMRMEFRQV